MKNRAAELFGKIARSVRSNMGWKIVSLAFAVLLWNYVIAEVNPARPINYTGLQARIVGIEALHSLGLTPVGDPQFDDITVTVELRRQDVRGFTKSDIDVYVDVSAANKEGEVELRVRATPSRGTFVRVTPERISLTVEKLKTRNVPITHELEGTLPQGYWRDTPQISPDELEVTGAASVVDRVDRAVVTIPVDNLKESVSMPRDFVLQDEGGGLIDQAGLTFSKPNVIVDMTILPQKTVRIVADSSLIGSVAEGYEIKGAPEVYPTSVVVAGPAEALAGLEEVTVEPFDIMDAQGNLSAYRPLNLPDDVVAVSATGATISVAIDLRMTQITISDLPVTITGIDSTLSLANKVQATAVVDCPELVADRVRREGVMLYADASNLGAGSHSLAVRVEIPPDVGVEADAVTLQPEKILITLQPVD